MFYNYFIIKGNKTAPTFSGHKGKTTFWSASALSSVDKVGWFDFQGTSTFRVSLSSLPWLLGEHCIGVQSGKFNFCQHFTFSSSSSHSTKIKYYLFKFYVIFCGEYWGVTAISKKKRYLSKIKNNNLDIFQENTGPHIRAGKVRRLKIIQDPWSFCQINPLQ